MPRTQALDPLRNFKFRMLITGFSNSVGWTRISGLKEATEVVEYREGTDEGRMRKLFGQTSYDPVTCERGMSTNNDLVVWRSQVKLSGQGQNGQNEGNIGQNDTDLVRKDVEIRALEYHGRLGIKWDLEFAWPSSLEFSELGGDGNDVLLETMELVHEGLRTTVGEPLGNL